MRPITSRPVAPNSELPRSKTSPERGEINDMLDGPCPHEPLRTSLETAEKVVEIKDVPCSELHPSGDVKAYQRSQNRLDGTIPTLATQTPSDISHTLGNGHIEQEARQGGWEGYPVQNHGLLWKIIFFSTICSAQLVVQAQSAAVIVTIVDIGVWLGTNDPGKLSWMAASWGLSIGMFLIASGRLGDMYGPKMMFTISYVILIIANVASGFCISPIPFIVCRALAGMGAAMALPSASAIMGRTFPPGRMRNIGFSIIGATAPVGFCVGALVGGGFARQIEMIRWTFWTFAVVTAIMLFPALYVLPPDEISHPFGLAFSKKHRLQGKFDYLGSFLLSISLGLFNFSWNQSALTGWQEPYIIITLIISIFSAVTFYFWERRLGSSALVPTEVLGRTSNLVYLSLFVGWASLGIWDLYLVLFLRNIRGAPNSLTVAIQFLPSGLVGLIAALIVPTLMTKIKGHIIFFISMVCYTLGNLLLALAPPDQTYWGLTFVSILVTIWGPDLSFATGSLIVSNAVPRQSQGVAGGMVAMITTYSASVGLGMAGTVEKYAVGPNGTSLEVHRAALYFATALSGFGLVVVGLFVRMPKQVH